MDVLSQVAINNQVGKEHVRCGQTAVNAEQTLAAVQDRGFIHVQEPLSLSDYECLVNELGAVVSRSEIKLDPERVRVQQATRKIKKRPSAYRPDALGFHSDNPTVDILAWYCVEQDEKDGAILLLDTADLPEHFSTSQLEALSGIRIWFSDRVYDTEDEKLTEIPVLSKTDKGFDIYYQPWLLSDERRPENVQLIHEFASYVRHKEQADAIRIQLTSGECLLIDNHRMLHGRGALTPGSKRHLVRFFIRIRNNDVGADSGRNGSTNVV